MDDKFAIDILELNKRAQIANGLKHGDYRRYHLYCTKKLHRLRKALKWTQGRGRFVKRKVEEEVVSKGGGDARYLLLVLLQAERAWSHGMELKEEAALLENSKKRNKTVTRRKRQWPLRKWRKAALWAKQLEKLCVAVQVPTKTLLEAQAYAAFMSGNALLEKKQQRKASLECFQRANAILEKLEQTQGISAQQKYIYRQYMQEMEPAIRYCQYQLSKQNSSFDKLNDQQFLSELEQKGNLVQSELQTKENEKLMLSVEWRGTRIPIANRRVQQYLSRIANLETSSMMEDTTQSKIIFLYNQAVQLISKEWEQLSATGMDEQVIEELGLLKDYLVSNRVQLALKRNWMSWNNAMESSKATSWRQRIRLVEQCIQLCEEILQLKSIQSDIEASKFWSHRKLFFRAYRRFYLASYLANRHRWIDSYLLCIKAAEDMQQVSKKEWRDEWIEQRHIDALQENITRQSCISKAYAFLEENQLIDKWNDLSLDSNSSVSIHKALVNRLQEIVLPTSMETSAKEWKIVDLQPSFMKVPCKPFLFDLASEELSFPDISVFANEETKPDQTRKGLLGKAVSWFSGRK